MTTGTDLTAAIIANDSLMGIGDCTTAYVQMGLAIYGSYQNDGDDSTISEEQDVTNLTQFASQSDDYTAVWHFQVSNPMHHFIVMPFKNDGVLEYSVFMAYADSYTLKKYVEKDESAPAKGGYRDRWSKAQLEAALKMLMGNKSNVRMLFFNDKRAAGKAENKPIVYHKYPPILINGAIANVSAYVKPKIG